MYHHYIVTIIAGFIFSCLVPAFVAGAEQVAVQDKLEELYQCPERGKHSCGYVGKILKDTCFASRVEKLGRINGKEMVIGEYERNVDFDWSNPEDNKLDTYICQGTDSYIFELSDDGLTSVVWHKFSEHSAGLPIIGEIALFIVGDESVVSVDMCLDGTGGCYDENYIQIKDTWRPLEKDASWTKLYEEIPKKYRPHKSRSMNFDNMTWEQSLAKNTDPNCCPTGLIKIQLSIKKHKLHVESYRFVFKE